MASFPDCCFCGAKNDTMKRCTRCQSVYYCGRTCQVKDWGSHKPNCLPVLLKSEHDNDSIQTQTNSSLTFGNSLNETDGGEKYSMGGHAKVNFTGALDQLKNIHSSREEAITDSAIERLTQNQNAHDSQKLHLKSLESQESDCHSTYGAVGEKISIIVKANKSKCVLDLYDSWTGVQMMKTIVRALQIPDDKLKLVCRGKLITAENIKDVAKTKALFQAIGEKAESEAGLVTSDIDVIMSQLSVERNVAVRALRDTGDVVDAMLRIANK